MDQKKVVIAAGSIVGGAFHSLNVSRKPTKYGNLCYLFVSEISRA